MTEYELKQMTGKLGVSIRKSTSMSASASDDLPLSKRKQTGRRIIEHIVDGKHAEAVEAELQSKCEGYLRSADIAFIRIPDALYRWIFGAKIAPPFIRKLISSYLTGIPDLVVLFPNGRYICAELKARKGKMTQGQLKFARKVQVEIFRDLGSFERRIGECIDDEGRF